MGQFVIDFTTWLVKFLGVSLLFVITVRFFRRRLLARRRTKSDQEDL